MVKLLYEGIHEARGDFAGVLHFTQAEPFVIPGEPARSFFIPFTPQPGWMRLRLTTQLPQILLRI